MKVGLERPDDAEEAAIQAGIAADPDNPEWTEADFAAACPAREILPQLLEQRLSGDDRVEELIRLRLDRDVVDSLRARGNDWQAQVNATLRAALGLDG